MTIFFRVGTKNISNFKVRFLAHKSNLFTFDAFQQLERWVNSDLRTISRWIKLKITVIVPSLSNATIRELSISSNLHYLNQELSINLLLDCIENWTWKVGNFGRFKIGSYWEIYQISWEIQWDQVIDICDLRISLILINLIWKYR